jgi:uncharacterized protein
MPPSRRSTRAQSYRPRVLDVELDERASEFAAIAVEGPKGVGKTETARRRANTEFLLDGPVGQIAKASPEMVVAGDPPILIDEWQRVPATWDVVRRAVDDGAAPGTFLLAGSASEHGTHSGAGRIIDLRMRPMTLSERGVGTPTVSLRALLEKDRSTIGGQSEVTLEQYAHEIVASGFPAARTLSTQGAEDFLESYASRIVDREFEELGRRVRRPETLRRWMTAYAAATATTASFETIRAAATGGFGEKPARTTTEPYRETLERLFIVDPVPAWVPTRNRISRLTGPPKHHLADPALAASLLGADVGSLLSAAPVGPSLIRDGTLFGALFESLVTLSVRVFAQLARARVAHMRTKNGDHEVDLIVVRRDGRVLAIEVKLATLPNDRDVRHLHWLASQIGTDLVDSIVVTAGAHAYRRPDGIGVVPLAMLGA